MTSATSTLRLCILGGLLTVTNPAAWTAQSGDAGPEHGDWGVEIRHISDTIDPGDDFYAYVNDGWINTTELPPGFSSFSEPWVNQLDILDRVNTLIRDLADNPGDDAAGHRVSDVYRSYLDRERIENLGLEPIQADLVDIEAIETYEDIARWMADPRSSSIFHLLIQPPVDMQGGYVLALAQYRVTGLGLPGQVYFESDEDRYPQIRSNYRDYIAATLTRAGLADAEGRADAVLAMETELAHLMWDFAQLRDAGAAFNLIPMETLADYAPGFPWETYMQARGLDGVETLNISVGAIIETAAAFERFPVDTWRAWLAFHWIDNHAALLPEAFDAAEFAFYRGNLYGVTERPSLEERAIEFVQYRLDDDVGALYVDRHFPPSNRASIQQIEHYVRLAFQERLLATEWMDDATRAEAMEKLDAIIFEVGEPETGINWSGLETDPGDLIGNVRRIAEYEWAAQRARIGQPISRYGDWNMGPHRVGLGYHQQYNKIFITAGGLEPPFFDPHADAAVNFGSIGATIGHEFGHALDDQGSRFDSDGALRNWWSDWSREAYEARTSRLIEQFGAFEVLPGASLASRQMIGEIVGDLVGASIGYRAYELYAEDHYGGEPPVLDGFTGAQRFFLSAAQISRTISNEQALRSEALHASHPPARFRINGIMQNLDEWYQAFEVTEDDALYLPPEDRVRLW
ncbi:M13 family metallopeptidase [Hyphobacterium sp.]|uniref:M13 family metallopeptidase n=1 Tax=Hyphobacterium sp. TaxID=2004662 RepID=UPI003BA88ACC